MSDFICTRFGTKADQNGTDDEEITFHDTTTPIEITTTFLQPTPGRPREYAYSRCGNPTRTSLERKLAALEESNYALTFGSGMAATSAVLSLLKPQDHMIAANDIYGGTREYFKSYCERLLIRLDFVLPSSKTISETVCSETKMVWIEGLSNPTLRVGDISGVASVLNKCSDALLVVDNTFLTPYFSKPLCFGADIVIHSVTKYINGFSDVTMGSVALNSSHLYRKLHYAQQNGGAVPSPLDCFLVSRAISTLHLRMEKHLVNSFAVARFLETHPLVRKVYYPGLDSHPDHVLALNLTTGYGGVVSFVLDIDLAQMEIFVKGLKIFALATTVGCVQSLVEVTPFMAYREEDRRQMPQVEDGFVRLAIGIECKDDLVQDLKQALELVKY